MLNERKVINGVTASTLFSLSLIIVQAVSFEQLQPLQKFKLYVDPEGRYEIGYLDNWYVNEDPSKKNNDIVVQFDYDEPKITSNGDDIALPSVRIRVRDPLPDELSLEKLSNKIVNNASLNPTVAIEESGYANLSGYTAYTMKCILPKEVSEMMWTLHNDNVYTIEYKANSLDYETYLPAFQLMVNTFHLSS
jgi:hypothetical protein